MTSEDVTFFMGITGGKVEWRTNKKAEPFLTLPWFLRQLNSDPWVSR